MPKITTLELDRLLIFFVHKLLAVILCPLSVTDSWVSEIEKYALKLRALTYIGDKEHRKTLRRKIYDHVQSHLTSTVSAAHFIC